MKVWCGIMQSSYDEIENKIKEVNKIINAMEQVVEVAGKYERNTEYIDVPINILKKEICDLSEKINHIKGMMIVTYDEDISYIDELLNQKKEEESKVRNSKEAIDECEDKEGNVLKNALWSKLAKKNK